MELIGEVNKNALETLKIQYGVYKEHPVINIRVWVENKEGKQIPTKKGLTISSEILGDFLYLVKKASRYLEENGHKYKKD